jgi:hypothetical protein
MKQQNASTTPWMLNFQVSARKNNNIKLNSESCAMMRVSHTGSSELP